MKYFLDTEFIESGPFKPIQLISIGLVCEDGREYYAVSSGFNPGDANGWIRENVFPHLGDVRRQSMREIVEEISTFTMKTPDSQKPEFWGYYADYDWVVFCQLFGTMIDLPQRFPKYCRDLKQWCDVLGNPELPKQESTEHNALEDARWNAKVWEFLAQFEKGLTKESLPF